MRRPRRCLKRTASPHNEKEASRRKTAAKPGIAPRPSLRVSVDKIVPHEWTIASYDPRLPAVLSTPAMIGMMEVAAAQAVLPELPPRAITVGARIEVDHLKAVPVGSEVRATAELAGNNGRFLVFEVEARSGAHVVRRGRVYRAIVETASFVAKAAQRSDTT